MFFCAAGGNTFLNPARDFAASQLWANDGGRAPFLELDGVFLGIRIQEADRFATAMAVCFHLVDRLLEEMRLMPTVACKRGRNQMPSHVRVPFRPALAPSVEQVL
jgi:hypothetical protein